MAEFVYAKDREAKDEKWMKFQLLYKSIVSYHGIPIGIGVAYDLKDNSNIYFAFDPVSHISYADLIFENDDIQDKKKYPEFNGLLGFPENKKQFFRFDRYSSLFPDKMLAFLIYFTEFVNENGLILFDKMLKRTRKDIAGTINDENTADISYKTQHDTVLIFPYVDAKSTSIETPLLNGSDTVVEYLLWNYDVDALKKKRIFFPYTGDVYGIKMRYIEDNKFTRLFGKSASDGMLQAIIDGKFKDVYSDMFILNTRQIIKLLKIMTDYFKDIPSYNDIVNRTDNVKKLQLVLDMLTPFSVDLSATISDWILYALLWTYKNLNVKFNIDWYNTRVLRDSEYFVAKHVDGVPQPIFIPVKPRRVFKNTFIFKDEFGTIGIYMKNTGVRVSTYLGITSGKVKLTPEVKQEIQKVGSYINSLNIDNEMQW